MDIRELFKAQILSHDQNLLPMLIRSQNLGSLSNDQNTIIGIKQSEEIIGIGDYVSRRVLIRRHSVDQFPSAQALGVTEPLDVLGDRLAQQTEHLSDGKGDAHPVGAVRVTCYETP